VLDQPLTIVLPVYNFERKLRSSVLEVLELAHSFTQDFSLVIVDDGSSDETYEAAFELARTYPQVNVLRQPARQGLGRVLEMVRNNLATEMAIVHDGISPIDVDQLESLLNSSAIDRVEHAAETMRDATGQGSCGSRRLASLRTLHDDLEHAHRRLTGFCWMKLEKPLTPRRCRELGPTTTFPSLGSLPTSSVPVPLG
jgi:Glycosyl transferase family 2